jgi:hypothetical protein
MFPFPCPCPRRIASGLFYIILPYGANVKHFCKISEKYLSLEILEEGCRNKSTSKNSGMKFTPLLHLDL